MFYFTQLPVFGQMGAKTEMDSSAHPPVVRKLHCMLDMVPTSDIWRVFPCIIVSAEFANKLHEACTGFELRKMAIFEPGDAFRHFHGEAARLPELHWCHIVGRAYTDDLGFADGSKLIISDKVKRLIESGPHERVSFVAGTSPPSREETRAKLWQEAAKVAEALKARNNPNSS